MYSVILLRQGLLQTITSIINIRQIQKYTFTSYGFRLKYVDPGLSSLSICCGPVKTESFFSIAFTLKYRIYYVYVVH